MYVTHLSLTNYRNYTRLELDLQPRVHIFQGENAQGKTNLLEAIYYLATTKSPLASSDRQLIRLDAAASDPVSALIPYAQARVSFVRAGEEHTIEARLAVERQEDEANSAASCRRQLLLDGVPRRAFDVLGRLNAVLFLPQDIGLVAGAPSERRRYLDVMLCQIDPVYCRALARYNRVMAQRNALLRQIRERQASPGELDYWDEQLTTQGAGVISRRLWAVIELGREAAQVQTSLTGGAERLDLRYQDTVGERLEAHSGDGGPDTSLPADELAERYRRALRTARAEETARGVTVVGPHRDDLRFLLNGVDATIYGSRGQQRTVTLALKLAEVRVIQSETGDEPVLLLDDVVSELDQTRCELLFQVVNRAQQVFMTTTYLDHYAPDFVKASALWRIASGAVSPLP